MRKSCKAFKFTTALLFKHRPSTPGNPLFLKRWLGIQADKLVILKALVIFSELPLKVLIHGGTGALGQLALWMLLYVGFPSPCTQPFPSLLEEEAAEASPHPWS